MQRDIGRILREHREYQALVEEGLIKKKEGVVYH